MGPRLEIFLVLGLFVISGLCVDSGCDVGYSCLPSESCVSYKSKLEDLRKVGAEKGKTSSEYKTILARLKSLICNKAERKFCCDRSKQPSQTPTTTPPPPPTTTTPTPDVTNDEKSFPNFVPNINSGECGVTGDAAFIYGGNDTKLGEFPWASLLRKVRPDGKELWHCGATLLNKWFVLTAAHCGPTVDFVRLGEWKVVDTNTFNIVEGAVSDKCYYYDEMTMRQCRSNRNCRNARACEFTDGTIDCEGEICAAPHQDIRVDKVIIHPEYEINQIGLAINDVMLVKLSQPVEYNTWVRPVCLPDLSLTEQLGEPDHTPPPLDKAIVVGWGYTGRSQDKQTDIVPSSDQQKLQMPVLSNEQCGAQFLENIGIDIRKGISKTIHLCAGGQKGTDSCKGDSGGPLLSRELAASPFMLVGVVSGGTDRCGIGAPSLFSRVSNYRQWIIDNMK